MDPSIPINQRVHVLASFGGVGQGSGLGCMPLRMKYNNQDITFTKLGLRHPTRQGARMLHIFDMSDGTADYRLEFDAESLAWTLVSILEGEGRS